MPIGANSAYVAVMSLPATDPDAIYDEHIAKLPARAKLRLLSLIAAHMAREAETVPLRFEDLAGLGREVWESVGADAYVHDLREEWGQRRA